MVPSGAEALPRSSADVEDDDTNTFEADDVFEDACEETPEHDATVQVPRSPMRRSLILALGTRIPRFSFDVLVLVLMRYEVRWQV